MSQRPLIANPVHPSQHNANAETAALMQAIRLHGGIFDKTGEIRLIVGGKIQPLLGYQNVDASIRNPQIIKELVFTVYQKDFLQQEQAFVTGKVDAIRPNRQMLVQLVGDRAVWTQKPVDQWLLVSGCTAYQNAEPIDF